MSQSSSKNSVLSSFFTKVFLQYAFVGVLGTAIDVGILALLVSITGIDPKTDHIFYLYVSISFTLAVINNFVLNQWWTFKSSTKGQKRRFVKFLLVALGGLFLSNILMFVLIRLFDIVLDTAGIMISTVLLVVIAKVVTSGIVLIWNFLLNKYWTFRIRIIDQKNIALPAAFSYDYSIVIPAYNEANRLPATLEKIAAFASTFPKTLEILVVNDGSKDNTVEKVKNFAREYQDLTVRIIDNSRNRGKGFAVRCGMLDAKGKYILFTDADNSTPIEELSSFDKLLGTADILIGSRYMKGSKLEIRQSWKRILLGRLANLLIQVTLIDDIKDTQCGFKLYSYKTAQDIFSRMKIDGFGFDMEALALAEVLQYSIREVPVSWYNSEDSRVRPIKDAVRTLRDLVAIKLNIWGGKYMK